MSNDEHNKPVEPGHGLTIEKDLEAARNFERIPGGWEAGNNGSGARPWFVYRDRPADHPERGRRGPTEYHTDRNGDLIHYTMAGAYRKAAELNTAQARLRRTPVRDLVTGDLFVKPGYLSVYGEDKDGWASLRADAGTRFKVLRVNGDFLTAQRVSDGHTLSQQIDGSPTVLKVCVRS